MTVRTSGNDIPDQIKQAINPLNTKLGVQYYLAGNQIAHGQVLETAQLIPEGINDIIKPK